MAKEEMQAAPDYARRVAEDLRRENDELRRRAEHLEAQLRGE